MQHDLTDKMPMLECCSLLLFHDHVHYNPLPHNCGFNYNIQISTSYKYVFNDILEFVKYQISLDFMECNSQNEIQKCNLLSDVIFETVIRCCKSFCNVSKIFIHKNLNSTKFQCL